MLFPSASLRNSLGTIGRDNWTSPRNARSEQLKRGPSWNSWDKYDDLCYSSSENKRKNSRHDLWSYLASVWTSILGGPYLAAHKIDQIHSRSSLRVRGQLVPLLRHANEAIRTLEAVETAPVECNAYVARLTIVPANSAVYLPLSIAKVQKGKTPCGVGLLATHYRAMERFNVHPVLNAIVSVDPQGYTWTSVLNTLSEDITIPSGARFGKFTLTCSAEEQEQYPGRIPLPPDQIHAMQETPTPDMAVLRAAFRKDFGLDHAPAPPNRRRHPSRSRFPCPFSRRFQQGQRIRPH